MRLTRNLRCAGFTLVEILVGIAVISAISSAGYVSVTNIRESARENKLEADVSSLNKATQSYLANGGVIPADADAAAVITKLKTRATSEVAATTVGMTGSFIDPRVEPVPMSESEAAGSGQRAVWNADMQRFVIADEGDDGIGSFVLNEELAGAEPVTEARTVKLAAADLTSGQPVWVWDFAPNIPTTSSSAPPPGSGAAAPSGTPTDILISPNFDVSGGSFALDQLAALRGVTAEGAFTLTITNPNSGISSFLSTGSSAVISPGESGTTFSSIVISNDPGWSNSLPTVQTYTITAFDPVVTLSAPGALTPFDLDVPRASGSSSPSGITATITNWDSIPSIFQPDSLQIILALGSSDPTGSTGAAPPERLETLTYESGWDTSGGAPTLVVSAIAKSSKPTLINDSSIVTQTLTASKGTLTVEAVPASGTILNAAETVELAASDLGNFPDGYTIKYTTDGTLPGPGHGDVYFGPIHPPADGGLVINAIALPPADYENWFESEVQPFSYTVSPQQAEPADQIPVGALFKFTTIQESAVFTGNLMLAGPADQETMNNVTFGGNAKIKGNLYLPGHPEIYTGWVTAINDPWNDQRWHPGNEGKFANHILGKEYTEEGAAVVPPSDGWSPTPRVIDLPSPPNSNLPNNYYLMFQNNFQVEGKVFRHSKTTSFPDVQPPDPPDNSSNKTANYNSWTLDPNNPNRLAPIVNPSEYANVELQTNASIVLLPGNYNKLTGGNGGTFVLGDPDHPDEVKEYSFSEWNLSGGTDVEIVGKVKITVGSSVVFHDGAVIGNSAHPDWLELRLHTTQVPTQYNQKQLFTSTGNSQFYGTVVAPNGQVTFENSSKFVGAVTAYNMQVKSTGTITLSLQPVTGESDI